eukprot:213719_1
MGGERSPKTSSLPSAGLNISAAPSTQYLLPDANAGVPTNSFPSLNTSPKCPPQVAHLISAPSKPACTGFTFSISTPANPVAKEGHPVPEWNFAALAKSGVAHPAQRNSPSRSSPSSMEEFGRSVPPCRRILYCDPLRIYAHSRSVLWTAYPSERLLLFIALEGAGFAAIMAAPAMLTEAFFRSDLLSTAPAASALLDE